MTTGSNNASPFASILSSSTGHKHTKCSKTKASGTAAASASSGLGALNGNDTLGIPHIYKL